MKTWRGSNLRKIGLGILGLSLLTVVTLYLAGVFGERISPGTVEAPAPLPVPFSPVRHLRIEAGSEDVIERFAGTVRAIRETVISSRILSTVSEVLVRSGQRLAAGDEAIVLDSRALEARELQARESLTAAESRHQEARSNFDRAKRLEGTRAISRQVVDAAEATFLVTRAEVENARKRLEEVQVDRSYASVRAPFDAVVIDRLVEPGDVVTPGSPLLGIYDPSRLRLEAFVRESMAVKLEVGSPVAVRIEALSLDLEGTVEEIVPQAEAGSRSMLVKVALPPGPRLYPGMFGHLLLEGRPRTRILVPAGAVVQVGQLRYLILDDVRRSRRLVVLGPETADGWVEILSGLAEGEAILVPGE